MLAGVALILATSACQGDSIYDVPTEPGGPGPLPPGGARGELITIPGVGRIADLVIDPGSQRVFLSNLEQHRVEVFDLGALAFAGPVLVGSEPWGLALNRSGDTLIVANSGGTNVSFVPTGTLQESLDRRFDLPRVTLYNYQERVESIDTIAGDTSVVTVVTFQNYTDRPQYVAQDYRGRLLYSARSTAAMPHGTMRVAEWKPGWQTWDARLLFPCCGLTTNQAPSDRATRPVPSDSVTLGLAIANVDSITLEVVHHPPYAGYTGNVIIWDHVPGSRPDSPDRVLRTPPLPILAAIQDIHAKGSDILVYPGAEWNIPDASHMADTTFVAVSADRRFVAFGERSSDRAGRLIMWSAADSAISRVEDIQDVVNNTSDRILGLDLNANGTLGVARGQEATYFIGPDLRLHGLTRVGSPGGQGAGFIPGAVSNRTYAFEPTGNARLRIIETTHYSVLAEIPLRESIEGPFRVGPPRPGVAEACPNRDGSPECVVATVYGVTTGRRLLVLDVQRRDFP